MTRSRSISLKKWEWTELLLITRTCFNDGLACFLLPVYRLRACAGWFHNSDLQAGVRSTTHFHWALAHACCQQYKAADKLRWASPNPKLLIIIGLGDAQHMHFNFILPIGYSYAELLRYNHSISSGPQPYCYLNDLSEAGIFSNHISISYPSGS